MLVMSGRYGILRVVYCRYWGNSDSLDSVCCGIGDVRAMLGDLTRMGKLVLCGKSI